MPLRRPHVLLLLRAFAADGPGRLVLQTLKLADAERLRVSAVVLDREGPLEGALADAVKRLGGELHRLPTGWIDVFSAARFVGRLVRERGVDVLHAHLLRPDVVGRMAMRSLSIPYIVTEHGIHSWGEGPPGMRPFVGSWYRCSLPKSGSILAISEKVRDDLINAGVAASSVKVLRNGIDVSEFHAASKSERDGARRRFHVPPESFPVLLLMGSLIARKSPEVAVSVVKKLVEDASWKGCLLVAGSGPLEERLRQEAAELTKQGRVLFAGQLAEPAEALAAADMLVHPAEDEPYGLVVAEALASGLPVLARRGGGADALLPSAPFSMAVEGAMPEAWASAINAMTAELSGDETTIRSACRSHAEAAHDIRRMVEELTKYYEDLCVSTASSRNPQNRSVSERREN